MKPVLMTDSIEENPIYVKHCISKVHVELRKVKPECYKPMAVSIGPYYHKCGPDPYPGQEKLPDLKKMQQFKQVYLNLLLERRNRSLQRRNKGLERRENYLSELAKLETKARKCYEDPMSTINDNEFTEMMLLDSCFVVEFIRKMNYVPSDENDPIPDYDKAAFDNDDPIGTVPWRLDQIKRDMILLENQLPYFVLSKFYDMTKYDGEKSFEEMAMSCFNASLPRPRRYFSKCKGKKSSEEMPMSCFNDLFPTPGLYFSNRASKGEQINHLLHLVHIFCHPSVPKEKKCSSDESKLHLVHIFCRPSVPKEKKCSSDESTSAQRHDSSEKEVEKRYEPKIHIGIHIGTVVEIQEAGVNFKKVDEVYNGELIEGTWNDYVSLFDIKFECGVMKVPCFRVDASTETLLRNFIAYEQECFTDVGPKYFTDFAMLMNQLINSEKDTKVLRYKGIIINFLGDDNDVSKLFNTLTDGVRDSYKSYFLKVRENVDVHCNTRCKIWQAYFNRNYCYNPCVCASAIVAAILLFLTVVQFIIALLTWLDIYP